MRFLCFGTVYPMRTYDVNGEDFLSVTTALDVLRVPGLLEWASGQALDSAFADRDKIAFASHEELKQLRAYHREQHERTRDAAAATGTAVHEAVASDGGPGAPLPEDKKIAAYVKQWRLLCEEHGITTQGFEATVAHTGHRYAGTLDAYATLKGYEGLGVLDIKTGKTATHELYALQVAAYAHANQKLSVHGVLSDAPDVSFAFIAHVRPRSRGLHRVDISQPVFESFLRILSVAEDVYGGVHEGAISGRLVPGAPEALLIKEEPSQHPQETHNPFEV